MALYGSVDLHSNNSYAAVSDETDKLVKAKRLPNRLEDIDRFFTEYRTGLGDIVIESTYNGYWLMDGLQKLGYGVKLVHMSACAQYSGLKYTDDESDCMWLNRMHRLGVLPTGYVYPRQDRPLRDLLRKRMYLVQTRTGFLNSFKHLLLTWNAVGIRGRAIGALSLEELKQLFPDPVLRAQAVCLWQTIRSLSCQIRNIELLVQAKTKDDPLIQRLCAIRGIGPLLAQVLRLETGEISRFKTHKNYLSYCGLVGSRKLSNQRQKGSGNRHNRNKFLRWAFAEIAIQLIIHEPRVKSYHDRLIRRKGRIIPKAIIGAKIARVVYRILSDASFVYNQELLFK